MAAEGDLTIKAKIVVVGSSNMDLVVKSSRIPSVGQTILGGDFMMNPGGKGANQAVAAAKLSAEVYLAAKVGDDLFGLRSLENLKHEGVNTRYVIRTKEFASGVAIIVVDDKGNNSIVVAGGANQQLSCEDVRAAQPEIRSAGAVVAQLEVPIRTVECAAGLAADAKVPFILDPAPAQILDSGLLAMADVLTPNETEAEILTGIEVTGEDSARRAVEILLDQGVKAVILTMGAEGFLFAGAGQVEFVRALRVRAVDTTAAGDAFTGSLAVGLAQGQPPLQAASFANYVAALSVTRAGAQASMPTKQEVETFIETGQHSLMRQKDMGWGG